jgi:hypothetical protein
MEGERHIEKGMCETSDEHGPVKACMWIRIPTSRADCRNPYMQGPHGKARHLAKSATNRSHPSIPKPHRIRCAG